MATHDYIISNASGAAVRADLNNALAAIVSNNSNASSPSTTYAYQWWADTTSGRLKLRNSANSAWIPIVELDGTMLMEDGTVSAPGLAFASDLNTGFFRSAADKINFAAGGSERLEIGSSEVVFNDGSNDVDFRVESNGSTHMLFVDGGNDRIGIGTASPDAKLHVQGELRVDGGSSGLINVGDVTSNYGRIFADSTGTYVGSVTSNPLILRTGNTEALRILSNGNVGIGTTTVTANANRATLGIQGAHGGQIDIMVGSTVHAQFGTDNFSTGQSCRIQSKDGIVFKTNGANERMRILSGGGLLVGTSSTSANANTVLQGSSGGTTGAGRLFLQRGSAPASNESMANIFFADNSSNEGAKISAVRDGGTWTSGSSHPTRLEIATTADGASSPTERLRIDSNGRLTQATDTYNFTTVDAANMSISSTGNIRRSTSSLRYKTDVETMQDIYADNILNTRPVWYRSICEDDNPSYGYWGFIAEEVAQIDPRLCFYSQTDEGEEQVDGVAYDRFVPHLLNLIKRQQTAIETLETKVAALEAG